MMYISFSLCRFRCELWCKWGQRSFVY